MWALIYVSVVGMSLHGPIQYERSIRGYSDDKATCDERAASLNYQPFTHDNMPYYYCEKVK